MHSVESLAFMETLALLFLDWKNLGKPLTLLCKVQN